MERELNVNVNVSQLGVELFKRGSTQSEGCGKMVRPLDDSRDETRGDEMGEEETGGEEEQASEASSEPRRTCWTLTLRLAEVSKKRHVGPSVRASAAPWSRCTQRSSCAQQQSAPHDDVSVSLPLPLPLSLPPARNAHCGHWTRTRRATGARPEHVAYEFSMQWRAQRGE